MPFTVASPEDQARLNALQPPIEQKPSGSRFTRASQEDQERLGAGDAPSYSFLRPDEKVYRDENGVLTFESPNITTKDPELVQSFINYRAASGQQYARETSGPQPFYRGMGTLEREQVQQRREQQAEDVIPTESTSMLKPPETPEEGAAYSDFNAGMATLGKTIAQFPFSGEKVPKMLGIADPEDIRRLEQTRPGLAGTANVLAFAPDVATSVTSGGLISKMPAVVKNIFKAVPSVGRVREGANLPGRMAIAAGSGAALGGLEGTISGALSSGNTIDEIISQGGTGVVAGGVLGLFIPAVEEIVKFSKNTSGGFSVSKIQDLFPDTTPDQALEIARSLETADPVEMARLIDRLAESGNSLASLPQTAQLVREQLILGGRQAIDAIEEVSGPGLARAFDEFESTIDDAVSVIPQGEISVSRINEFEELARRERNNDNYRRAFDQEINWDDNQALLNRLRTTDTEILEAANTKLAAGADIGDTVDETGNVLPITSNPRFEAQIKYTVDDRGLVTFDPPLTVKQVEYVRRSLNEAGENAGTASAQEPLFRQARQIKSFYERNESFSELSRAVSEFRDQKKRSEGRTLGNSILDRSESNEAGFLVPLTAEEWRSRYYNATRRTRQQQRRGETAVSKEDVRIGVRYALENKINKVFDLSANGSLENYTAAIDLITSSGTVEKMTAVLGRRETNRILERVEAIRSYTDLHSLVSTHNRALIGRQQSKQETSSSGRDIISSATQNFGPVGRFAVFGNLLKSSNPTHMAAKRASATAIIEALKNKRGESAVRAVRISQEILAGRDVSERQAQWLSRYVLSPSVFALVRGISGATSPDDTPSAEDLPPAISLPN